MPGQYYRNGFSASAAAHTAQWARHWAIFDGAALADRYSGICGLFASYGYPFGDEESTQLAANWCAWLYALDDGHLDTGRTDPVHVAGEIATLMTVLEGRPAEGPLARALDDILHRSGDYGTRTEVERFRWAIRDYLYGCFAEITFRSAARYPSPAQYLPLRLSASADLPCMALAEILSANAEIPILDYDSAPVSALRLDAGYIIALANDVLGCPREIANCPTDFVFNLALVCAHEDGNGLQAGLDRAAATTNDHIRAWLVRSQQLQTEAAPGIHGYVRAIDAWVRGVYFWMIDCGRYSSYWPDEDWPASPSPAVPVRMPGGFQRSSQHGDHDGWE